MAEVKTKIVVDTSDIEEAIIKVKILNEELEKAKSLIDNLAGKERTTVLGGSVASLRDIVIRELRNSNC